MLTVEHTARCWTCGRWEHGRGERRIPITHNHTDGLLRCHEVGRFAFVEQPAPARRRAGGLDPPSGAFAGLVDAEVSGVRDAHESGAADRVGHPASSPFDRGVRSGFDPHAHRQGGDVGGCQVVAAARCHGAVIGDRHPRQRGCREVNLRDLGERLNELLGRSTGVSEQFPTDPAAHVDRVECREWPVGVTDAVGGQPRSLATQRRAKFWAAATERHATGSVDQLVPWVLHRSRRSTGESADRLADQFGVFGVPSRAAQSGRESWPCQLACWWAAGELFFGEHHFPFVFPDGTDSVLTVAAARRRRGDRDFDRGTDREAVLAGSNSARSAMLTRWDEIPGGDTGDRGGDPVGGE